MAISKGNSKLGKIPNISLIPIKDCGNCKLCSKDCYALKAWKQYPDTRASWRDNSRLAHKDPEAYRNLICSYLEKKNPSFFRYHVAGDMLDQKYLDMLSGIAEQFPDTIFLAFTKMHNLDYSSIPDNFSVVFSRWVGDKTPKNPCNLPYAWMQDSTETRIPNTAIKCPGTCDTCGMCFQLGKLGRDVYFDIH
jgi:hypothetical protein